MAATVEFETIPELLYGQLARYRGKNRPVLSYKDKNAKEWVDISWEGLVEQVEHVAGYLYTTGVRPGDRVAILSENRPEWAVMDMATMLVGAVNVSLYTSLPAAQVAYIIKDSGASLFLVSTSIQLRKAEQIFPDCPDLREIITMSELRKERQEHVRAWSDIVAEGKEAWRQHADEIRALTRAVTRDSLCALIYTSGTTGNPKGVMLTHGNISSNAQAALELVPFTEDDHHLSFLPLCHSFERTGGYTAVMAAGGRISYAESIDTVSRNLVEVHPTVMVSVPRLFEKIYNAIARSVEEGSAVKKNIFGWAVDTGKKVAEAKKSGRGPGPLLKAQYAIAHRLVFSKLHERIGGNIRFAVSGGAALPRVIGEFFEAAGIVIIEGYGLTETAPVLAVSPFDKPRFGSVGHVLPGVTVAIQRLSNGTIIGRLSGDDFPSRLTTGEGEIVAKGPNVMLGYWNNEDATREAIDADGWYHTGDVGRFDKGYLLDHRPHQAYDGFGRREEHLSRPDRRAVYERDVDRPDPDHWRGA